MNKHYSEELEKLIGKKVKIIWFDRTVSKGILIHNNDGRIIPYMLITDTNENNYVFYKSHIAHIESLD